MHLGASNLQCLRRLWSRFVPVSVLNWICFEAGLDILLWSAATQSDWLSLKRRIFEPAGRRTQRLHYLPALAVLAGGKKKNSRPAVSCLPEIKDSECVCLCVCVFLLRLTCVCLSRAVSGNYTGEPVDNAATIRLATVSSMFSFQGCHTEKTMQHTCWLRRELPLFYCQPGAQTAAAARPSWYSSTPYRSLDGLVIKVCAEALHCRPLKMKFCSWKDIN